VDLKSSKLRLDTRSEGDVIIIDMIGELTLDDGDLAFRSKVHELLDHGHQKILLNLAGVTKIDSAGVGMLVGKLKTVRERQGDIKLMHLTSRSSRLLGVMKILTAFESYDDESMAVKSFAFDTR